RVSRVGAAGDRPLDDPALTRTAARVAADRSRYVRIVVHAVLDELAVAGRVLVRDGLGASVGHRNGVGDRDGTFVMEHAVRLKCVAGYARDALIRCVVGARGVVPGRADAGSSHSPF